MSFSPAGQEISTILRHDDKQTSYKIALLRSINDVVLNFPDFRANGRDVAVPLLTLADFWIAYYWPFVDSEIPILQGPRAELGGELRNDMAFRPALTELRNSWVRLHGKSNPSDGFFLINELRVERKREALPKDLIDAYKKARREIARTIRMPVRYAGPNEWTVFPKPRPYYKFEDDIRAIPGTKGNYSSLIIRSDLWDTFQRLSLWIEALCIHEWCLFTEAVQQKDGAPVGRGEIYCLLTDRPDNRVALTWERNQIDILLMEGHTFVCPWTETSIRRGISYDLDHLLPISVYPINELWNLVPADPDYNSHVKRDRLPSDEKLKNAQPHLSHAYTQYLQSRDLEDALRQDVSIRFAGLKASEPDFPEAVAGAARRFIERVAQARNLARF